MGSSQTAAEVTGPMAIPTPTPPLANRDPVAMGIGGPRRHPATGE